MDELKNSPVIKALEHMVTLSAFEGNVYPQPAVGQDGDQIDVIAFALNAPEIFVKVREIITSSKYGEFAFGLDRLTGPNQGTDPKYTDVYTIFHHLGDGMWTYWMLPYTKGDVGELMPASSFWSDQMEEERLSKQII